MFLSWGIFPDQTNTNAGLVKGERGSASNKPEGIGFEAYNAIDPFKDPDYLHYAEVFIYVIYGFSTIWLLGLGPYWLTVVGLLGYDFVIWIINFVELIGMDEQIRKTDRKYDGYTWENFFLWPTRKLLVNYALYNTIGWVQLLPFTNIAIDFILMGLVYLNTIVY